MIVLDTNVVSEAMKPEPNPVALAWLDHQAAETLYLSSVTLAELLYGVGAMPTGRRKERLAAALDGLQQIFMGRIIPFDTDAARHYAKLTVQAREAGQGFPLPDGYIAAIAVSHGFAVATRDSGPFQAVGLNIIDPWQHVST